MPQDTFPEPFCYGQQSQEDFRKHSPIYPRPRASMSLWWPPRKTCFWTPPKAENICLYDLMHGSNIYTQLEITVFAKSEFPCVYYPECLLSMVFSNS